MTKTEVLQKRAERKTDDDGKDGKLLSAMISG